MFLIDRPAAWPGPRADLMPAQLFGGAGDLIRAALVARPPAGGPAFSKAQRVIPQGELAPPASARRRKAG